MTGLNFLNGENIGVVQMIIKLGLRKILLICALVQRRHDMDFP
jgi:hypothetical protein